MLPSASKCHRLQRKQRLFLVSLPFVLENVDSRTRPLATPARRRFRVLFVSLAYFRRVFRLGKLIGFGRWFDLLVLSARSYKACGARCVYVCVFAFAIPFSSPNCSELPVFGASSSGRETDASTWRAGWPNYWQARMWFVSSNGQAAMANARA